MVIHKNFPSAGAEEQLRELGIKLPAPPEPFGTYAEAVQTGNLVFLTGMLSAVSRVDAELNVDIYKIAA